MKASIASIRTLGLGLTTLAFAHIPAIALAEATPTPPQQDVQVLKSMSGCFQVDYVFREYAMADDASKVPGKETFRARSTEWIDVDSKSENSLLFNHILLTGSPQFPVFKHFSQEWAYEPEYLFRYTGDDSTGVNLFFWEKLQVPAKEAAGRWVSRTFQIDESPRFECLNQLQHFSGVGTRFLCEAWSPLPTREKGRKDYTVLARNTMLNIMPGSAPGSVWFENEMNFKVNGREPIAKELGSNTYTRIEDSKCEVAKKWWNARRPVWRHIQAEWKKIYEQKNQLQFKPGAPLWSSLTELAEKNVQAAQETTFDVEAFRTQVKQTIESHLTSEGQ